MKQATVQLIRLLMSAVTVLFCFSVLFGNIGGLDMKSMGSALAERAESWIAISENGMRLARLMELPPPQVEADDTVYLAGETYPFPAHIRVRQNVEDTWRYASETEEFSAEILDIIGGDGKTAGGDWQSGELMFSQSGRYVVKLRVIGPYGRYAVRRIAVPVEEA